MRIIKLNHDKVNFVYTTDWHLAAKPPGRRQDDYQASILAKIAFVREMCIRLHAVGLCGGDVFHSKNPKSPSNGLSLLFALLQTLRQFPHGMYGSVGNHDLSYDRMDTLPHQPLGLLIAAGVYHDLNEEPILFVNENETVKVLVETFPYQHAKETLEHLLKTGERPDGVTHRIGVVHSYGEPGNGREYFGDHKIGYNQVQHLDYDFFLWGHDHSRHDTETVGNITHVNLGSLARAAYDYDEIDRPVIATVISFAEDGIRYKEKEIPVKPLNIAFTTADKPVEDIAKSEELKEFFDAMDEQVGDIEATDPNEVLKALCPDDEVKLLQLVKELCEI